MVMAEGRGRTCGSCGANWRERTARFCGHCGAVLGSTAAGPETTPPGGRRGVRSVVAVARSVGATRPGRWAAVVVATFAMAGGAHLAGISVGSAEDHPSEATDDHVDLPETSEVRSNTSDAHVGCVPEGCERWRIDVELNAMPWPGDGILIETERLPGGLDGVGTGEMEDGVGMGEMEDGVGMGEMEDGVGSEEMEGRTSPAVPVRLRVYALATGELLWERAVRALPGSAFGVDGALAVGDLVLVATPSGLTALEAEDGEPRWVSGPLQGGLLSWTTIDGDLILTTEVVAGSPLSDEGSEGPPFHGPRVDIWRIDADTGEIVWRAEDHRLVGFGEDEVFVAGEVPGSTVVLEAADGTIRWEQDWPELGDGGWWPQTANGRVVLNGERSVVVASLDTGETIAHLDREQTAPGPTYLVGDVAVLGPPWREERPGGEVAPSPVTLVALGQPEPRTEVVEDVVSVAPLSAEPWIFSQDADGLMILVRTEEGYAVRVLDPSGELRWERQWVVEHDGCCWTATPGIDGRTVLLIPEAGTLDQVQVLSREDGRTMETVAMPLGLDRGQHVTWAGPVAVAADFGRGGDLVVVGPGGRFSAPISGGFGLYGVYDGVLVVSIDGALVGLDMDVLAGNP
jgi:outer membrane protein assembly factor BamB